jgi:hypothetical protein
LSPWACVAIPRPINNTRLSRKINGNSRIGHAGIVSTLFIRRSFSIDPAICTEVTILLDNICLYESAKPAGAISTLFKHVPINAGSVSITYKLNDQKTQKQQIDR